MNVISVPARRTAIAAVLACWQLPAQVQYVDLSPYLATATCVAAGGGAAVIGGRGVGATTLQIDANTLAVTSTTYATGSLGEVLAISDDGTRIAVLDGGSIYWIDIANGTAPQFVAAGFAAFIENVQGETRLSGRPSPGPGSFWYTSNGGGQQALPAYSGPPLGLVQNVVGMSADADRIISEQLVWQRNGNGYDAPYLLPTYYGQYDTRAADLSPAGNHCCGHSTRSELMWFYYVDSTWPTIWPADYAWQPYLLRFNGSLQVADAWRVAAATTVTDNLTTCGFAAVEVQFPSSSFTQIGGWIWHPSMGSLSVQSFQSWVAAQGGPMVPVPETFLDMVDDGTYLHILYRTSSIAGPHYVRAPSFSTPATPFYVYGPGTGDGGAAPPHLQGQVLAGTGAPGDSVQFEAEDLQPPPAFPFGLLAFSLAEANALPLLIDASQLLATITLPLVPASGGTMSGSFLWTLPPGSSGQSVYAQYVGFSPTGQLVFSNGLRLDIQ